MHSDKVLAMHEQLSKDMRVSNGSVFAAGSSSLSDCFLQGRPSIKLGGRCTPSVPVGQFNLIA